MAREYSSRRPSRSQRGAPHQFLMMTLTFLLGYLTASVFDVETVTRWLNSQVLAHREIKKVPNKPEAQQAAIPPKPKFEFYTLLANEKVPGSQPSTNSAATQPASATKTVSTPVTTTQANTVTVTPAAATPVKQSPQPVTAIKVAENKPGAPTAPAPTASKGNFLVQVASFKARQDAEHMKGSLTLKGFNVYIVPVVHATKGNWFRVVVGPYTNRGLAQQAQTSLAKNEHLHGMVTAG